jgi:adiponectin receptor
MKLSCKQDMPEWRVACASLDSSYYPLCHNDWSLVLRSLFVLHNETANIYSHVFGFLLALWLGIDTLFNFLPSLGISLLSLEGLSFLPLCFGSCAVCFLSATYHTVYIHSKAIEAKWVKLDYLGITLQVSGGFVTLIASLFFCNPHIAICYVTTHLGVAMWVAYQSQQPRFGGKRQVRRTLTILALMSTMVFPVVHSYSINNGTGNAPTQYWELLWCLARFFFSQTIGALFYTRLVHILPIRGGINTRLLHPFLCLLQWFP